MTSKPHAPRTAAWKLQAAGVIIFLAGCIIRGVLLVRGFSLGQFWGEGFLVLLGVLATACLMSRWLPLQNWVTAIFLVGLLSAVFEWGVAEWGGFTFCWLAPVIWVPVLLNGREMAHRILQPWRSRWSYGFWLIGIAGGLTATWITALGIIVQPAGRLEFVSLGLRLGMAWLLLIATTPFLIPKRPVPRQLDSGSLAVWSALCGLLVAAAALERHWNLAGALITINALALWRAYKSGR